MSLHEVHEKFDRLSPDDALAAIVEVMEDGFYERCGCNSAAEDADRHHLPHPGHKKDAGGWPDDAIGIIWRIVMAYRAGQAAS